MYGLCGRKQTLCANTDGFVKEGTYVEGNDIVSNKSKMAIGLLWQSFLINLQLIAHKLPKVRNLWSHTNILIFFCFLYENDNTYIHTCPFTSSDHYSLSCIFAFLTCFSPQIRDQQSTQRQKSMRFIAVSTAYQFSVSFRSDAPSRKNFSYLDYPNRHR